MAGTTGIGWTDATVNFWIGCTEAGPGCDGCYAREFAERKFPRVNWGPGGHRHLTKSGYESPLRWQRLHDRGQPTMRENHADVPVPRWVFACSLSDFFDNEVPDQWRTDAWAVIRSCPALRWQIVTKRVGNAAKMLPADWNDGIDYPNVGIIATAVNQQEVDRDTPKLLALKEVAGVRWVGLSIEPQLGPITLREIGAFRSMHSTTVGIDWVIIGGESNQGEHKARQFDQLWAADLLDECELANVSCFMKQMGDNPVCDGKPLRHKFHDSGSRVDEWSPMYRVQQMPRVFDNDQPYTPRNLPKTAEPTLL